MSTIYLRDDQGRVKTILTVADVYEYGGFRFDISHGMPQKVNKDGEASKRAGSKFWAAFHEWQALPKEDRKKYRI